MKNLIVCVGIGIAALGASALVVGFICAARFWSTEIVPFFWERGNIWPAVVPSAIALLIFGGVLVGVYEDKPTNQDSAS